MCKRKRMFVVKHYMKCRAIYLLEWRFIAGNFLLFKWRLSFECFVLEVGIYHNHKILLSIVSTHSNHDFEHGTQTFQKTTTSKYCAASWQHTRGELSLPRFWLVRIALSLSLSNIDLFIVWPTSIISIFTHSEFFLPPTTPTLQSDRRRAIRRYRRPWILFRSRCITLYPTDFGIGQSLSYECCGSSWFEAGESTVGK